MPFLGGQKPDQGRVKLIPDLCQVFELPAKALLQVIRSCKYDGDNPDLLAWFCDSHATQNARAKRRAISNTAMQKR
jgi:hypothetical protein